MLIQKIILMSFFLGTVCLLFWPGLSLTVVSTSLFGNKSVNCCLDSSHSPFNFLRLTMEHNKLQITLHYIWCTLIIEIVFLSLWKEFFCMAVDTLLILFVILLCNAAFSVSLTNSNSLPPIFKIVMFVICFTCVICLLYMVQLNVDCKKKFDDGVYNLGSSWCWILSFLICLHLCLFERTGFLKWFLPCMSCELHSTPVACHVMSFIMTWHELLICPPKHQNTGKAPKRGTFKGKKKKIPPFSSHNRLSTEFWVPQKSVVHNIA